MSAPLLPGPLLFVRYACPPNALGYCGPADSAAFLEYGLAGVVDPGLVRMARSFSGVWPYLELIAGRAGIPDPLDRRVVEAYWVGNSLLDPAGHGRSGLRGLSRSGLPFDGLAGDGLDDAVAHHSFHVLCVYPWVGLLADPRKADHALGVLDGCRIGWGRVTAVRADRVTVTSRPLTWDGCRLGLGEPVARPAGTSMVGAAELSVGDWVSLHWHWICDRLSGRQVRALRGYTMRHLDLVNRRTDPRGRTAAPQGR